MKKPSTKKAAPQLSFTEPKPNPKKKTDTKAIADRAEETGKRRLLEAAVIQESVADVDIRKPAPAPTAEDYLRITAAWISQISNAKDGRERWTREAKLREEIGLTIKEIRLLKAGLDGRCNRIGG